MEEMIEMKKRRQILKEISTVSCIFPQAVTCSDIFCCFYGNARFFFFAKVNIEFVFGSERL